jgi:hypothetical protein
VGKQELLDLVCPRLVVEENNLHVQLSTLRKLLGPQVIATIPGRGYQFVAAPESNGGADQTTKKIGLDGKSTTAQRSKRRGSVAAPCSAGPLLRSRDCRKTPRARPPASLYFPERRPPRVSRVFMFPISFRQSFPAYRYLRGR